MEDKHLTDVTEEEFDNFLEGKNYKRVQGYFFHSDFWLDDEGNSVAYKETSSYGAPPIYKILKV